MVAFHFYSDVGRWHPVHIVQLHESLSDDQTQVSTFSSIIGTNFQMLEWKQQDLMLSPGQLSSVPPSTAEAYTDKELAFFDREFYKPHCDELYSADYRARTRIFKARPFALLQN